MTVVCKCMCLGDTPRKNTFGFLGFSCWSLITVINTRFLCFCNCLFLLFKNVCNVETGKPGGKPHWKGKWKTKDMILIEHDILPQKIHLDTLDGVKISFLQTGTAWPSRPDLKRRQILNFALSWQMQLLRRKVLQKNSLIPAPFLKSKVTFISKKHLLAALPLPHQSSFQLVGRKTSERYY